MENNENEYILLSDYLKNSKQTDNNLFTYSNLNDVIVENDLINTDKKEKEIENYLYQPQIINNLCKLVIVGYTENKNIPNVKLGEINFINKKLRIISHLYDKNYINNCINYIDFISLVFDNLKIKLTLRYTIKTILEDNTYNGNFSIYLIDDTQTIKIKDIDKFDNINKSIELLIKELSNPIIIDKYD